MNQLASARRRTCALVALVLSAAATNPGAAQRTASRSAVGVVPVALVFDGVSVVDVTDGRLLPKQMVVIVGNRVRAVGPVGTVRTPKGAHVVDARGKYLMPGLWDMHVHVRNYPDVFFPLFVATGVTGVRDMGNHVALDSILQWRREILAGARVGPRLVTPGNGIRTVQDSLAIEQGRVHQPGRWPVLQIATPEEGRHVVDSLKTAGADFLKIHGYYMPRELYFAITDQARKVGLPVVGHVPGRVTPVEASDSGHRSIEHFNLFPTPCQRVTREDLALARTPLEGRAADTVATGENLGPTASPATPAQQCAAHLAPLIRNGTWLTPTLAVFAGWLADTSAYGRYWPDTVRADNLVASLGEQRVKNMLAAGKRLVGVTHPVGLPLLAGTDVAPGATTPMIHGELALFVEAGLTPAEALRTATLHPAQFFGATDSLGTVAPGKLADLVLLDADPFTDITNTTKIRAVVANGRYFDRVALDRLLADLERKAK